MMIAPTPYFSDRGCHVRIYEEAKALVARGHQVVIVAYHLGRDMGDIPVVRIPSIAWYRKISAGPSWHKPYIDLLLLYKALVTAKKFKPEIIHAHLHEGAFLAAIAKRSFAAPILFDCQGSLTGELLDHGFMQQHSILHKVFTKVEAWITRQADHIITSSTSTAELIQNGFSDVAARLTPLIDAVDTDNFKPLPREVDLLMTLGIPTNKKLIVYLGAMNEYQGVDLLLEALVKLSRSRVDFHALLMGYPEDKYINKAEELGISDNVTFSGQLDYTEAPRYLSLGDIAVSPKVSATEANGKLLNYMACGLPCVVFDNKINHELLGDCGVYVGDQSSAELAGSLEALLDNEDMCQKLSAKVLERAEKHHSWSARILELEKIYRNMLGEFSSCCASRKGNRCN